MADEAYSAETLEELANLMRVPANLFKAEVEGYNREALQENRGIEKRLVASTNALVWGVRR